MIKYIIAVIVVALFFRVETTGNLKLMWGALCSFMAYIILFFIDLMKELS
jgi:hypothetical protein